MCAILTVLNTHRENKYPTETHTRTLIESGVREVPAWGCRIPYEVYSIRLRETPLQLDPGDVKSDPQLHAAEETDTGDALQGRDLGYPSQYERKASLRSLER
jgi:hypothetical protein